MADWYRADEPKGEIVLVVAGAKTLRERRRDGELSALDEEA